MTLGVSHSETLAQVSEVILETCICHSLLPGCTGFVLLTVREHHGICLTASPSRRLMVAVRISECGFTACSLSASAL